MSTNYSTDEVLDAIHTALAETGYGIRKHPYMKDVWEVYNNAEHGYLIRGNETVVVHNAYELLTAIGGEIGRYGDNEILQPLRDEELLNETMVSLEESGYPKKSYATIFREWKDSDDPAEQGFWVEHHKACALFDLIVNQPDSLKDPTLFNDLYEMEIPHIMAYKMDAEAPTEVGEIAAIVKEYGYTVVPNGNSFSVIDENGYVDPNVFCSTTELLGWLDVTHDLVHDIKATVGISREVSLDPEEAIALVEDLAATNDKLFASTVGAAARLDTIMRYASSVGLSQLAVMDKAVEQDNHTVKAKPKSIERD